jgi:periplasmic divalent cation tolerance protein
MDKYIQITTTLDKREDADKMAQQLVAQRLAACVQIVGPITSSYRWEERIEVSEEWLCLIKTEERLYSVVEDRIKEIHPYELPEIVAFPITRGSSEYLSWISQEIELTR